MWLFSFTWLLLLLAARPSLAGVIRARPNPGDSIDRLSMKAHVPVVDANGTLENIGERYVTTITLNDRDFRVALDTGSSDLWIVTSPDFPYTESGLPVGIDYVDGVVNGTVGFASMQLGDYSFSSQAFVNASVVDFAGILELGLDGLMGLGLDGNASDIIRVLAAHNMSGGQPFVYNIRETPDQEHFFAISLSRTDDLEGSADASFTVDELDDKYARIADAPMVPLFPCTSDRWSILVDAITVDGNDIPLVSTVPHVPNGSFVALMDTGTPTATLPPDILYAVYSQIPGASVSVDGDSMWFAIPCNTTAIVTVFIGGLPYPIHPLDLSEIEIGSDDNGNSVAACISTIQPLAGGYEFDALFGDAFMRNVYSVFNFGGSGVKSPTGAASIQLLSQTDPTTAVASVHNARIAQLADFPPESYGTLPGFLPVIPGSSRPISPDASDSDDSGDLDPGDMLASGAVTNAAEFSGNGDSMRKYALVIIGLLSGNLVVVLVLAAFGYTLYIKRRGKSSVSIRTPRYIPVEAREEGIGLRSQRFDDDCHYSD